MSRGEGKYDSGHPNGTHEKGGCSGGSASGRKIIDNLWTFSLTWNFRHSKSSKCIKALLST